MTETTKRIHLSLVSHTNIGKTTLARTLLGRDVGIVADRAHVTETTDDYVLAKTDNGSELILWDTPGFGNSVALARRLEGRTNPVGWFVSEVWDRLANRTQWLNQQALKHIQDTSHVVLYLVNASEIPGQTSYIDAEMKILEWIGKPVIILLNQMGQPKQPDVEASEVHQWKEATDKYPIVRHVMAMDAFARCWVQEVALFDILQEALNPALIPVFSELRQAWTIGRKVSYAKSIKALYDFLDTLVSDKEGAADTSLLDQVRTLGQKLKLIKQKQNTPIEQAQKNLSIRANNAFYRLTDELIAANHLSGNSIKKDIFERLQSTNWTIKSHIKTSDAAIAGAIGSGAVGGLAADMLLGGMSLGMGSVIGGILGALGGAGLAHAFNVRRDALTGSAICWSEDAIHNFAADAILLYLAIAHYGRGRGDWIEGEYPAFWKPLVKETLAESVLPSRELPLAINHTIRAILYKLYPSTTF